jgi:hypothetical protein
LTDGVVSAFPSLIEITISIFLDILVNCRLIYTCFNMQNHATTTISQHQRHHQIFQSRIARFKLLRIRMFILYGLLLLFDAIVVAFFVFGSTQAYAVRDNIFVIGTACIITHFLISFALLDMFVEEFQRIKNMQSELVDCSSSSSFGGSKYPMESMIQPISGFSKWVGLEAGATPSRFSETYHDHTSSAT